MNDDILAIDPGTSLTGWCLLDPISWEVAAAGNTEPRVFLRAVRSAVKRRTHAARRDLLWEGRRVGRVAIEQITHYGTGMPAGASVFDTCRLIGRLEERFEEVVGVAMEKRSTVKTHLCRSPRAKDSNVRQGLSSTCGGTGSGSQTTEKWSEQACVRGETEKRTYRAPSPARFAREAAGNTGDLWRGSKSTPGKRSPWRSTSRERTAAVVRMASCEGSEP